jgi:hypothetical protein
MRFGYNLGCGVIKEIVNYKSFSNGQAIASITLPEKLIREQEVKIRPQSFVLYELETLAQ